MRLVAPALLVCSLTAFAAPADHALRLRFAGRLRVAGRGPTSGVDVWSRVGSQMIRAAQLDLSPCTA